MYYARGRCPTSKPAWLTETTGDKRARKAVRKVADWLGVTSRVFLNVNNNLQRHQSLTVAVNVQGGVAAASSSLNLSVFFETIPATTQLILALLSMLRRISGIYLQAHTKSASIKCRVAIQARGTNPLPCPLPATG
ncbi:hypothetical protein UPYG_G00133400 [Umbra pygmaea]|uniref:Uncharacterized protein n=1 Tax=Umbra pygmaea TaxID=75934 RepID=A0ABD0WTM1_UMBPY